MREIFPVLGVCQILLFGFGCSALQTSQETHSESSIQWKREVSEAIVQEFESRHKFKHDTEVAVYLRDIAQKLADSTPELEGLSFGVLIIRDRGGKWINYGLPNKRVYLSSGLLREVEYENEVAAAIALQLAHIKNKSLLKRLIGIGQHPGEPGVDEMPEGSIESPTFSTFQSWKGRIDYFGINGLFSFADKTEAEAVQTAVGILYRAGYDSRGIITLLERYKDNLSRSPFDKGTLDVFIDLARSATSYFAPLRNPIVRTKKFLLIQQRMRRL